ncbi:MAG: hypothetical protein DCF16_09795 [Alphaproteobacteria bacterium]|nr:MAG: hypothetical protein DCF16_09795 [Alphaproteobacteria bacterium]
MPIAIDGLKLIADLCVLGLSLKLFKSRHKELAGAVTVGRECQRNLSIAGADKAGAGEERACERTLFEHFRRDEVAGNEVVSSRGGDRPAFVSCGQHTPNWLQGAFRDKP